MQYSLEYNTEKEIVIVNLNGRLNFKVVDQYSKEAIKLARENNCTKFFINHSETTGNSENKNMHTSGEELQQFGFLSTDKLAILVSKQNKLKDLIESPRQNSRWSVVKFFKADKSKQAIEWLSENDNH